MARRLLLFLSGGLIAIAVPIVLSAQTGTFKHDWLFKGAALTGTQQVGQVAWRAENGEIIATPSSPDGGWLLLPGGFQDVQVGANFKCAGACQVGVMLRSEKTADGTKGLYAVLAGADRAAQAVTIDAQGKFANREPITRGGGGQARLAPPLPPPAPAGGDAAAAGRGGRAGGRGGGGAAGAPGGGARGGGRGGAAPAGGGTPFVSKFPENPGNAFKPADWNRLEALVEADVFRYSVNGGGGGAVAVDGKGGNFGPVALYVGGTGEVRFKDLAIKDLNKRENPTEIVGARFKAIKVEDFYLGWSMAAGDFNKDGSMDVTVGNRYYLGPNFTVSHELYLAQPFNPAKEYSPAMVNWAGDYTGDGWDDILVAESRAPALYVNPRGESRRWTRHTISPQVVSESIMFHDINGDGKLDPVFSGGGVVQWITPDPANPTSAWKVYAVSAPGIPASIHGIGAGDINGDGKADIIAPHGWWEQPAGGATQVPWTFHQEAFGRGGNAGGNMEVYDVNGDRLPDIVTALSAHLFGLGWYEQKKDAAGKITWVEHVIMDNFATKNAGNVTFTEPHALTIADIDGDGIKDIVTGKRHWAHLESYSDPDPMGPAVLYWYRTVRRAGAPGGAEFVPELIHNRSGVGSMVTAADINKDGAPDILVGTNRGGYIFLNRAPAGRRGAAAPAAPAAPVKKQ
jgi:hypothetical protein